VDVTTYPGVGSIKFGAKLALSQCPGTSSAQSEWDKYGWEITAVGLWFVAVIGAALIIRGCHKLGRQKRKYVHPARPPALALRPLRWLCYMQPMSSAAVLSWLRPSPPLTLVLVLRRCSLHTPRSYMSLNDEGNEDGDGVYQASLQRSGNGRVGMGRIRQEIISQEQALSTSSSKPTTRITQTERALAARANNGKGALLPPNTNKKPYG